MPNRVGIICWNLLIAASAADYISIEPSKDNFLYISSSSSSCQETNFGARTTLRVGQWERGRTYRSLLYFDVAASIPTGAVIIGGELKLSVNGVYSDGSEGCDATNCALRTEQFFLHRVTTDWGEGEAGSGNFKCDAGEISSGDSTWRHSRYPTLWERPGGDYESVPFVAFTLPIFFGDVSIPIPSATLKNLVDKPSTNRGFIMIGDEANYGDRKNYRGFASRERSLSSSYGRPVLRVEVRYPTLRPTPKPSPKPTARPTPKPTTKPTLVPTHGSSLLPTRVEFIPVPMSSTEPRFTIAPSSETKGNSSDAPSRAPTTDPALDFGSRPSRSTVDGSGMSAGTISGIVVGTLAAMGFVAVALLICQRKRHDEKSTSQETTTPSAGPPFSDTQVPVAFVVEDASLATMNTRASPTITIASQSLHSAEGAADTGRDVGFLPDATPTQRILMADAKRLASRMGYATKGGKVELQARPEVLRATEPPVAMVHETLDGKGTGIHVYPI